MDFKSFRESTGLKQGEFAHKFGVPLRTVVHWEHGDRVPPEYVVQMAKNILLYERELIRLGSDLPEIIKNGQQAE